jgi:hypothetical protein
MNGIRLNKLYNIGMIRKATMEDFDKLMPMWRIAHKNSVFSHTVFDENHCRRAFAVAVAMPNFFLEVSEKDGKVRGIFAGMIDKTVFGAKFGVDVLSYSFGETAKLIERFEEWAKERGAEFVQLTDSSNNERYQRLLTNEGYAERCPNFVKEI